VPRIVDTSERRAALAEAVWRVVARDGLEHASVRNVAAEAGLSAGSLRHFFTSQSELLAFAMRLVMQRVSARIEALEATAEPLADARRALAEFLPLDERRRTESEVWLAFTARALVDPLLRELREASYDALREGCRYHVRRLTGGHGGESGVEMETARLYALVDGLLVHGVIRPDAAAPAALRAVLDHHLGQLAAAGAG
jgi:AcrR family transcriptional regulator